jgi:hypothetical protein
MKKGPKTSYTSMREYWAWAAMKERCNNPNCKEWKNYGARGIGYHSSWEKFTVFLKDVGLRPPGTSLDRIKNNENYGPDNCRGATPKQQSMNRRGVTLYKYNGQEMVLKDICQSLGLAYPTIQRKKHNGTPLVTLLGFETEIIP